MPLGYVFLYLRIVIIQETASLDQIYLFLIFLFLSILPFFFGFSCDFGQT